MRDDRVHARMALVRDLFGLSTEEDTLDSPGHLTEPEPLAEVRQLPRAGARGGRPA